jgi:mono/diheme cytochrome c family protein
VSVRLLPAVIVLLASCLVALAEEAGDRNRGLVYAEANCTECHAVGRGEFDSPNVYALPFGEIANTPGISQLALVAFFQTAHEDMPNFIIPEADTRNLIAYILSLKKN